MAEKTAEVSIAGKWTVTSVTNGSNLAKNAVNFFYHLEPLVTDVTVDLSDCSSLVALSLSEDASSLGSDNLGYGRIRKGGNSGGGRDKGKSGSAQVLSVSNPAVAARFNSVVGCYQVDRM